MGKKVKAKKAGMLKRKQRKQGQKAQKRRLTAKRPQMTQNQQVMQLLRQLPTLIYEPPLDEFSFDLEQLKEHREAGLGEPDTILALTTATVLESLKASLSKVIEELSPTSTKGLLGTQMLEAWNSETLVPCTDPLIVALYLRAKAAVDPEFDVDINNIGKAVETFFDANEDFLETLSQAAEQGTPDASSLSAAIPGADGSADAIEDAEYVVMPSEPKEDTVPVIDPQLLEEFKAQLSSLDEEAQEQHAEDLDVFLSDYLQKPFSECTAEQVDQFINQWFVEQLNPLEEDVVSMKSTLKQFFDFMEQKQQLSEEQAQQFKHHLMEPA